MGIVPETHADGFTILSDFVLLFAMLCYKKNTNSYYEVTVLCCEKKMMTKVVLVYEIILSAD